MRYFTPSAEDEYSPFVTPARPRIGVLREEEGPHPGCTKSGIGIQGTDDRRPVADTLVVPSRWICQLWIRHEDSNRKITESGATGVLVSPRHVLTVAHAFHSTERDPSNNQLITKEAVAVRVAPGRDGSDRPFGTVSASVPPRFSPGWSHKTMPPDQDYALLTLDSRIGDKTFSRIGGARLCYWGAASCGNRAIARRVPPQTLQGATAFTSGYPKDLGNGESPVHGSGVLTGVHSTRRLMSYSADACQGQSGSPVWVDVSGELRLVGLLVMVTPTTTLVLRVTRELSRQLRTWLGSESDAFLGEVTATTTGGGQTPEAEWGEAESYDEAEDDAESQAGVWIDAPQSRKAQSRKAGSCRCCRASAIANGAESASIAESQVDDWNEAPADEDESASAEWGAGMGETALDGFVDHGEHDGEADREDAREDPGAFESRSAAGIESISPDGEDAWTPEQVVPGTTLTILPFMADLTGPLDPGFYGPAGKYVLDDTGPLALQPLVAAVGRRATAQGMQIAVVDLSRGLSSPRFAGVAHTKQVALASTGKLLAMYAAYQLRAQMRRLMAHGSHATPAATFAAARTAWLATQTPPAGAAVTSYAGDLGRRGDLMTWKGSDIKVPDGSLPNLTKIFRTAAPINFDSKAASYVAGSATPCDEFAVLSQAALWGTIGDTDEHLFLQRMRSMIGLSDDRASATCIDNLGFCYLNALMVQSGLWHPARGGGMWLQGNYGRRLWRTSPLGGYWQNGTAGAMASLLTLLERDLLVDAPSCTEMRAMMRKGAYPGVGTYSPVRNVLRAGGRESTVFSKLGHLKAEKLTSDAAIVKRTDSSKALHYVVVILNARNDGATLPDVVIGLDDCIRRANGL